jgi:AraC-like DNA-binding protein
MAIPDRFQGLGLPPAFEADHILLDHAALSRLRWNGDEYGVQLQMEQSNGYLLCYQRKTLRAPRHWVDGKSVERISLDPGQFLLFDLRRNHSSVIQGDVESFSMFVSRDALTNLQHEHDLMPFSTLRIMEETGQVDPTVQHLMECLVPAFEIRGIANRLLLDQVTLALTCHVMCTYGERDVGFKLSKGGLAAWQERRSKELLLANPRGELSLERLARECCLSRAHFARSFKKTTGKSPMAWLLSERLERAKTLLVDAKLTLTEIAELTGFADQSHFSRVFSRHVRIAPGEWRRRQRL